MGIDITAIVVAFVGLVGSVLVVWLPLHLGKKAGQKADGPPPAEPRATVEAMQHERTRDLIRDQTGEMRNLFGHLHHGLFGSPPPTKPLDEREETGETTP